MTVRPAQEALFEIKDAVRPLLPAERIYPGEAKWTAWRGVHRPCEVCGRVVLQMGVNVAPPPMPARWKRQGPNGDMWVCSSHQMVLKPADDEVIAYLKTLRATAAVPVQRKATGQRQFGS